MTGRELNEQSINKRIERKLAEMPGYAAEWNMEMQTADKSASTRWRYMQKLDQFLRYIGNGKNDIAVSEITRDKVVKYCNSLLKHEDGTDMSDSYRIATWFFLNKFFGFMVSSGRMTSNPMDTIERQKRNKDLERINSHRVRLSQDDFNKIMKVAAMEPDSFYRARNEAILAVMMGTGIRETAVTSILCDDIHGDTESKTDVLTVTDKGDKRQEFVVFNGMDEAVCNWMNYRREVDHGDPHLFLTKEGNVMSRDSLTYLVKKYTKAALGKALSPHKLRSGVCTILYEKTGDIEFVRRFIGHTNIRTTERYIVTDKKERRKGAELLSGMLA